MFKVSEGQGFSNALT
eukprot:UN17461